MHIDCEGGWEAADLNSLKVNERCQVWLKPLHIVACCWSALLRSKYHAHNCSSSLQFLKTGPDLWAVPPWRSQGSSEVIYIIGAKMWVPGCPHSLLFYIHLLPRCLPCWPAVTWGLHSRHRHLQFIHFLTSQFPQCLLVSLSYWILQLPPFRLAFTTWNHWTVCCIILYGCVYLYSRYIQL